MKKVCLVASIAMLVGVLMVGCGGSPVSEYMKQLDPIADIGIKAANVYTGLDLNDPEGAVSALQNQVIPTQEDYVAKLNALTSKIKDEKVKNAHAIMIKVAELQLQGYKGMLQGIAESDAEVMQEAQAVLVESQTKTNEFSEAINALTKK